MPTGVYQHKSRSEETRKKISEKMREIQKGQGNSMYGKKGKLSGNWRGGKPKCKICGKQVVSRTASICGKCHSTKGEKNGMWKGGITPEIIKIRQGTEMRLWRKSVFSRDNFTCQKYGAKGGILCAHHINNFADFPELRFAIDNGITLSEKAHKEFHKKYGKKNNTKEQLLEFLSNK